MKIGGGGTIMFWNPVAWGLTLNQQTASGGKLGFDVTVTSNAFGSPALGAGSPRFSIILSTGVTLFGSAIYCSGPTNALGTSIPFELGPAK